MDRPTTSKPRGICRYYTQPRGCFSGKNCKFLHGVPPSETLTPFDKAKTCRYYATGYCRRGENCWFLHTVSAQPIANSSSGSSSPVAEPEQDTVEDVCCICFEKPVTYGLLAGCSHVFCIQCIRQWRDPKGKSGDVVDSGVTKKCPMCRAASKYITPSSRFFPGGHPGKEKAICLYKGSTAKVPCRYFQQSKAKNRAKLFCPFGKDCFYQHLNDDGTPHVFADGVDRCMRQYISRQRRTTSFPFPFPFSNDAPDVYMQQMLSIIFDNPINNLGATMDAIRAGLGRVENMSSRAADAARNGADGDAIGSDGERQMQAQAQGRGPAPGPWNVRGDGGREQGQGWAEIGWNDVMTGGVAEAGEGVGRDREGVVMERLERLADSMLASLAALRNDGGPPNDDDMPPLEPIDRDHMPAPRVRTDDDMPALEPIGAGHILAPRVAPRGDNNASDYDELPPLEPIDDDAILSGRAWGRDDEPDAPVPRLVEGNPNLRDGEDDDEPPGLESCSDSSDEDDDNGDQPPGLQEYFDFSEGEDEDDELPGLQQLTDSSDEGEDDEGEDDDEDYREPARAFDLVHPSAPVTSGQSAGTAASAGAGSLSSVFGSLSTASAGSAGVSRDVLGLSSPSSERSLFRTRSAVLRMASVAGGSEEGRRSGRFGGVREPEKMVIDIEDEDGDDEDNEDYEDEEEEEEENERGNREAKEAEAEAEAEVDAVVSVPLESPFMTDARGKVVWSNSGAGGPSPGRGTQGQKHQPPKVRQPEGGGFTTDGRGRVIGTSEAEVTMGAGAGGHDPDPLEGQPRPAAGRRSLLGRVFGAIFPL